jgi:hypothetical protein
MREEKYSKSAQIGETLSLVERVPEGRIDSRPTNSCTGIVQVV